VTEKTFDVIVFGATSFVGQILVKYFLDQYGVNGDLKWAIAGRSQAKLASVKNGLEAAADLQTLVVDAADENALKNMCEQTQVVITTVGPYAFYGEPLVKACVETGTDYCDLTGEMQWIAAMIQKYEAKAKETGARIIHCCGFDSIPSDMGVFYLQEQAKEKYGAYCNRVKMRVKNFRGGFSGGTVASLMNVAKEAAKDKDLRAELSNPYSLCESGYPNHVRQPNVVTAERDTDYQTWLAPFVMAAVNTRIVFRTNSLLDCAYGTDFRYDEAMMTADGAKGYLAAQGTALGMGGFMIATAIKPTRWVLENYVVPKPGEGPSPELQRTGFFDIRFHGTTPSGQMIRVKVTGDRDPGYGSTAKMLGEAGVCLARDIAKTEKAGGFWTTATVFGNSLIERLVSHAGLTFELDED
jgi:short subunit dehydrogenase-like uncharacterized protein